MIIITCHKLKKGEEKDKLIETYNLPRLTQEEVKISVDN